MKCGGCGQTSNQVFKCDLCGDVRCGTSGPKHCSNTRDGRGANNKGLCKTCKKGNYQRLQSTQIGACEAENSNKMHCIMEILSMEVIKEFMMRLENQEAQQLSIIMGFGP